MKYRKLLCINLLFSYKLFKTDPNPHFDTFPKWVDHCSKKAEPSPQPTTPSVDFYPGDDSRQRTSHMTSFSSQTFSSHLQWRSEGPACPAIAGGGAEVARQGPAMQEEVVAVAVTPWPGTQTSCLQGGGKIAATLLHTSFDFRYSLCQLCDFETTKLRLNNAQDAIYRQCFSDGCVL